jgi:hypothetical protein
MDNRVYIGAENLLNAQVKAMEKLVKKYPPCAMILDVLAKYSSIVAGELFGYTEEDEDHGDVQ